MSGAEVAYRVGDAYYRETTARRQHRCEVFSCDAAIRPGQVYFRAVLFPGDVNSSGRPWVMRICEPCEVARRGTADP